MRLAGETTILLDGKPIGRCVGEWEVYKPEPRPMPSPGFFRAVATLVFAKEQAKAFWEQFNHLHAVPYPWRWRKKQPRPTPKQYRLKRRAAGSKRRNRR